MSEVTMSPRRPYMLRAVYDWIVDNQMTPHLVVDAEVIGCQLPWDFVRDGQIVLNIAPAAVGQLSLGNDYIEFNARFAGQPQQVRVPMAAALALYARENGAGSMFEEEQFGEPDEAPTATEKHSDKSSKAKASHLKVVK